MADEKVQSDVSKGIVSQMKELVAMRDQFEVEQLKFIKNLVNPDLSDNELYMFLVFAGKCGLNPFNKEIIAIVYSKNDPEKRRVSVIVARDGKRAVAYRKGGMDSITTQPIYIKEKKTEGGESIWVKVEPWQGGILWGATSTVVRNGKTHTATVPLKEYNTNQNLWSGKPETMIKKVAESQALSMAVPELLGSYDEAEMPTVDAMPLQASTTDDEPANEAQIDTIKSMAKAQNIDVQIDGMTQGQAKQWMLDHAKKKK